LFNKIKILASSFFLTLPITGYCYENLAEDIVQRDLNRSFAMHLNDITGSESYFHSPQDTDIRTFRNISSCKEYGYGVAKSYKEANPSQDVIVTERSLQLLGDPQEKNVESSILVYLLPNKYMADWAVGQTFYCMRKDDGTAEQLSFMIQYGSL